MVALSRINKILLLMIGVFFMVLSGCGDDDDGKPEDYDPYASAGSNAITGVSGDASTTGGTGGGASAIVDAGRTDGSGRRRVLDGGRRRVLDAGRRDGGP